MQTSTSQWLLGAILFVQVIGFYTLWQQNNTDARQSISDNRPAAQEKSVHKVSNPNDADYADQEQIAMLVRSILQEVLEAAVQQYRAETNEQHVPTPKPVDPMQNQIAIEKSSAIVDSALAIGKWQHDDNLAIMQLAGNLTMEQRISLLEKLGDAINRGELELEATPPPL